MKPQRLLCTELGKERREGRQPPEASEKEGLLMKSNPSEGKDEDRKTSINTQYEENREAEPMEKEKIPLNQEEEQAQCNEQEKKDKAEIEEEGKYNLAGVVILTLTIQAERGKKDEDRHQLYQEVRKMQKELDGRLNKTMDELKAVRERIKEKKQQRGKNSMVISTMVTRSKKQRPEEEEEEEEDQAALAPVSASDPATEDAPAENTQDTGNVAILSAISSLRFEIRSIKSDIGDIIDSKIEQLAVAIRGELTAFQQEASSAISAVKITVDEHASKLAGLEANASTSSDTVAKLEQEMGRLKQVVEQLSDKCMDLEGRSRRQNIRILHIKEGAESGMKTQRGFIAQLLMETLSLDNLPLVDRAHRALRNRPADDEPPRAFIIRLHYTHEMEEILRKAAKMQQVTFRGQRINIFPDYPPAVVKRRALFKRARELLKNKPGVKYGLQTFEEALVNGLPSTFSEAIITVIPKKARHMDPADRRHRILRLAELREIIVRQGAIIRSYQDQLEALQSQLSRVSIDAPCDPPSAYGESLRLALPEKFDASADRCRGFLRQYEVFFSHQPGMYREEGTKCAFLLSLMTDRALEWASAVWDAEPQVKSSFDYFAGMIREVFEYPTGRKDISVQLMELRQGSEAAADYAIRFRTLAAQSGWNDAALWAVFRAGLNPALQAELACHVEATSLSQFVATAIRLDNLQGQHQAGTQASAAARPRGVCGLP
ncbi:hypothetical protein QTP70_013744 [Hemibagrus guttatus]|uniref:Retrotransposon gag domain-containing protein n=1 Tax=Hemibagrus guttatus TaxID=175788 RepID=A0AAE0PVG6_9TELE|nr:hypothetical protein QTP70_013744 [Hemibagrus guttatus]